MSSRRDTGLDTLLDLNGELIWLDEEHWVKFEAKKVQVSESRPHGIKYCLTLHNKHNERLFGIDNAHSIKVPKGGKFNGYIYAYDHMHLNSSDEGTYYEFKDAGSLVTDFWTQVNTIIQHRTLE